MAVCNNLKQLEAELKRRLNATLQDDVVKAVKETEQKHVQRDVYAAYKPKYYQRRMSSGGLIDEQNMVVETGDLEVSIDNQTSFNNGYDWNPGFRPPPNNGNELEVLVEYGDGGGGYIYNYPSDPAFTSPRPFIHNTVDELKNGKLRESVVSGLAKRGVIAE